MVNKIDYLLLNKGFVSLSLNIECIIFLNWFPLQFLKTLYADYTYYSGFFPLHFFLNVLYKCAFALLSIVNFFS